ncbi:winged helix-turn-helix domain-containing protein [Edaphobacter modestus]|uniref:DNA-binding winged helix-turn-helix (WHTH) protein n=1 Tax=Edaphobacter modestus TaxID=388466 RepID=A0A4Q7Z0U4_9BACT|nr:winged helix-turn-helix domain-containing protein [Edaphobacter modestus]RZU43105.1 DNA-binding winged helix-turn-helix (wHTH) protein [Edaphobacter modestus]
MMGNKSFVFRFSDVEVREREFSLTKAGKVLAVEPKAFRVLLLLLRTPQKVISKEELLNSVWGDTAVTEGSLTRCIWLLRRLLGDDVNEPRFIETVATVGYRFVCKVEVSEIALGDLQATDKAIGLSEADFVETPVQSARDLSRELKWISGEVGLTKASEPAPRRREQFAWGVAALCIALLTWLGVAHWRSIQPAESRNLRLSLLPPPSTSFVPHNFAISPDGRRLAFVAVAQDGGTALWIRSLASGAAQQLTGTEGATLPFWSPDSRQVGFFQASKLKSVDPSSGAVQVLCDAPGGFGGAWNDRGTIIFAFGGSNGPSDIGSNSILKVSASGGETQLVTKGNAPNAPIIWPSALPDGDHFLYFLRGSSKPAQKQGIYVGSLSTQESKLISSEIIGNTQFASSRLYYVRNSSLMAQSFDLKRLQLTGRPEVVSRQELEEAPAFSRTGFSVSDNGVVVFQSATESLSRLAWFDRSGKELEELPRTGYRDPALSRDGALLAVSSDEEHNGKRYIHIYDFARGTSTRVSEGGKDSLPVFSPDGKRVAYAANHDRTSKYIDVAATDGSGKLERLVASDRLALNDWSADGRFLVYMNFQNVVAPELEVLDLRNHSQTAYATGAEAQFSPDGRWIAFSGFGSSGSGDPEVYVGRFPGSGRRIQISNHGGLQARWRADGKELFYISMDKKLMAVAIDTSHDEPVAGVPHVLFQTRIIGPRLVLFQYAVSPDGSRFLINSMPSVGAAPLTVLMN